MNNLMQHIRHLIKWVLAALLLIPALGWGHGMMDYPNTRQGICINAGNYSWPPDGSGITPGACKTAAMIWPTPAERLYPLSHWHEFANNVPGHRDLEKLKAHIADGTLCSAGDPKKRGFDLALPDWQKTPVTVVNGKITIRIAGSQPHVPSYVRVFLTRSGYQATAPLKWSDLQLIHTEELSTYRTDWNASVAPKPSFTPAAIGFFQFEVPVPNGQAGDAILYTYWQREDTGNEGFGGCADITLGGGVVPAPWTSKGQFITPDIAPKIGETVRVRVFGDGKSGINANGFLELVDKSVQITADNQNPNQWGPEMVRALATHASIVQVGVLTGNEIVFNPSDMSQNQFYVANKDHSVQVSVTGGGNPGEPSKPIARIIGPSTVESGDSFVLDGSDSTAADGSKSLSFQWVPHWVQVDERGSKVTLTAPTVTEYTTRTVELHIQDEGSRQVAWALHPVTFTPKTDDATPQYVEGTKYAAGAVVRNIGNKYKCKPWPYTDWCAGAAHTYGPGTGRAWREAWDQVELPARH